MRAILINPQDKSVTEVDYNGDYRQIYQLIDATCFDCVRIDARETIYIDDEGLINGKGNEVGFFYVKGERPVALAGKGLILSTGVDARGAITGESVGTELTVDAVRAMIDWVQPARVNGVLCWLGTDQLYRMD